ncbi:(+)-menthofuran synthase [Forsythia ovata]|uniref:(+)-menthofuran synthase n=1 Tax=Forsythia ovata TaxID=205694 RepID=A0ABD1TS38_9LAMI
MADKKRVKSEMGMTPCPKTSLSPATMDAVDKKCRRWLRNFLGKEEMGEKKIGEMLNGPLVALGRKYSDVEESTKFESKLKELAELLGTFNPGDYIPWLNWIKHVNGFEARVEKLARWFDDFFEGIVEQHRNRKIGETNPNDSSNETDLVNILLLEIQRESNTSSPIETDTIKAIIFVRKSGTDTTYTAVEWAMAELLKHPKTMEKLQNEVRQIARSKLEITEDDLEKMLYLKVVMKESLRLHPPLPLLLPQECTQDSAILGYDIAVGTRVIINSWAITRDPLFWENSEAQKWTLDGLILSTFHLVLVGEATHGITFVITVTSLH